MRNINYTTTKEEMETIFKIARIAEEKAKDFGVDYSRLTAGMDLENVHNIHPLNLDQLLEWATTKPGDFNHDIFGIRRHFNRETLELEDGFSPRCTKR
jgi:hypothetical protein